MNIKNKYLKWENIMKALLIFLALGLSLSAEASEAKFQLCTEGDLSLLNVAQVSKNKALKSFIQDEVLSQQVGCVVSKPRFIHPMVCGTEITQVDTFIIQTKEGATYTMVIDSSYRSCIRCLRIPSVKSFKYEETPAVIPFNLPISSPATQPSRC